MQSGLNTAAFRNALINRNFVFGTLSLILIQAFWGCGSDSTPDPTLKIIQPADKSSVKGPRIFVHVKTTNFTYANGAAKSTAEAGTAGSLLAAKVAAAVNGGHIHVFLDKSSGLDADVVAVLETADTLTLPDSVPVGPHFIIMEGAKADHSDVVSMYDSVSFTVTP